MSKRDSMDSTSVFSDDASESNLSSMSGLTCYEEELNNVKQLITAGKKIATSGKIDNSNLIYENRIKSLNTELQNALKFNEQYKNRLFEVEHGKDLNDHSKFKTLLEQNMQLQNDLKQANDFIKISVNSEKTPNDNKLKELQKLNYDLYSQMTFWKNELIKLKTENDKNIANYNKLLQKCDEFKIDLNAKNVANVELKKKIMEQHVENQGIVQKNMKLTTDLASLLNDYEFVKKSEDWYKTQLKQVQFDKNKQNDELCILKNLHITKTQQIESLQIEIENFRGKCNELELINLKDKQNYERLYEKFQSQILNEPKNTICEVKVIKDDSDKLFYENTIDDFQKEVGNLQKTLQEQQTYFDILNKQNSDLVLRNTVMQKTLNEKESIIDNLKNSNSKFNLKINILTDELKQCKESFISVQNDKNKLELLLNSANFEKSQTDTMIVGIREDFNKFLSRYDKLIKELQGKEKTISILQKEKQELFMNHNWQVCELEETKNNFEEAKRKYKLLLDENIKLANQIEIQKDDLKQIEVYKNEIKQIEGYKHELKQLEFYKNEIQELKFQQNKIQKLELHKNEVRELQSNTDKAKLFNNEIKETLFVKNEVNPLEFNKNKTDNQNLNLLSNQSKLNEELQEYSKNLEENLKMLFENDERFKCFHNFNCSLNKEPNFSDENVENEKLGIYILNYLYLLTCKYNKTDISLSTTTLNSLRIKIGEILAEIYSQKRSKCEGLKEINKNKFLNKFKKLEKRCNILKNKTEKLYCDLDKISTENITLQQEKDNLFLQEKNSFVLKENEMLLKEKELNQLNKKCMEQISYLKTKITVLELEKEEKRKRYERINRTLLRKIKEHMRGRNIAEKNSEYFKKMYENIHMEHNKFKGSFLEQEKVIGELKRKLEDLNLQLQQKPVEKQVPNLQNPENDGLNGIQKSIDCLSCILNKSEDKLHILMDELSNCKKSTSEKDEEINSLSSRIGELHKIKEKTDLAHENLIGMYKTQILSLQESLTVLKGEKLFVERLCRDLKFALKTSLAQNEMYKDKMQHFQQQEKDFVSLPDVILPSPNIFDDTYVTHLLQLSKPKDNNNLNQLRSHINSLKVEVSHLQTQIAQKVQKNIN